MKKPFLSKRNWNSRALFSALSNDGWTNPGVDPKYKDFFMSDLVSEYDSLNLYFHLHPRRSEFSPYFVQYLDFWFLDERNHADGFFELNRLLFGAEEEDLIEQLKGRTGNFEGLGEVLSNEFDLLLLFAYDEYISVKTYKKDTFYGQFGHPNFNVWIKNLIADEAVHFGNAVKILRRNHAAKLDNAEKVLRRIVDLERMNYQNTFLFDHDGPHFLLDVTEVGNVVVEDILSILARGRQ